MLPAASQEVRQATRWGCPFPFGARRREGAKPAGTAPTLPSPPHQQPQLQKQKEIQVRKAGCGKKRGAADTGEVPAPSPLASPTPPRLPLQDEGHREGLPRTETALPSSTRGKGVPPEGEAPERCLPALSPTSLPGGGRRGAPLSHRRLRNGRAPRASHSSPQPGATRPPHWLQVTCRGGLRQ